MPIRVQVPGHGIVEFPDGMPQDEMRGALASLDPPKDAPSKAGWYQGIMKLLPSAETATALLPAAGGVVGAAAGGPVGAAIGAAIGSGARQVVQHGAELPGAVADIARNWREAPAMARGAAEGVNAGLRDVGGNVAAEAGTLVAGSAALNAIPSTARAAGKFASVMSAAREVPVDIEAPGQVALRIQQLAERGGSMPMAVRKFLVRITDPEKGAMTYEEARDFASNISRLSADEFNRLTPAVGREVANMRVALNQAVGKAANAVGKGKDYADAMTEYAKAMRLRSAVDDVIAGAKRAAPYAGGAGAGYWLTKHITSLLPGGD